MSSSPGSRSKDRLLSKETKITLVGAARNRWQEAASRELRIFRTRYATLVRLFVVTVSSATSSAGNFAKPQPAVAVDSNELLQLCNDDSALAALRRFLNWTFLGKKAAELAGQPSAHLVIRNYIHEAQRTSSFIVAHALTKRCVAVDATAAVCEAMLSDVHSEGLELVALAVTHAFWDVLLGVDKMLAAWPLASVMAADSRVTLSGEAPEQMAVTMTAIPAPAYSSDAVVFAVHIGTAAACFFTGPSWPLDALPRVDLAADEEGLPLDMALTRAYNTLSMLRQTMFGDEAAGAADPIIFPCHGGYSNMSNQLDLHWAAQVSVLRRMQHTRKVLKALDSPDGYRAWMAAALPLPLPAMYRSLRQLNKNLVMCRAPPLPPPTSSDEGVVRIAPFIDVRSVDEYCARHVRGAVNFPMTFPATAPGAKKAELWLACLFQPPAVSDPAAGLVTRYVVNVMCSAAADVAEVRRRFMAIGVGVVHGGWSSSLVLHVGEAYDWSLCSYVSASEQTVTCRGRTEKPRWMRLQTYEDLEDLADSSDTLVIDCRTPYEFRNGSHFRALHIPLAELCQLVGSAAFDRSLSAVVGRLMQRAPAGTISDRPAAVIIYCAAGYRSHIAVSLFQHLLENAAEPCEPCPVIRDVEGGALRVMMLRPDCWRVKDRSIVCIS